jgi:hypothetical protein
MKPSLPPLSIPELTRISYWKGFVAESLLNLKMKKKRNCIMTGQPNLSERAHLQNENETVSKRIKTQIENRMTRSMINQL